MGRNLLLGVIKLPLVSMDIKNASQNWYSLTHTVSEVRTVLLPLLQMILFYYFLALCKIGLQNVSKTASCCEGNADV